MYNLFKKFKSMFETPNYINSSLGVSCICSHTCSLRHTTTCKDCKYNVEFIEKSYYKERG